MGFMKILSNKQYKQLKIQASHTEEARTATELMYGIFSSQTNENTERNNYVTYDSQVHELYKMYYAESDLGNDTTSTVIDLRTALIAGEGISVICKDVKALEFINKIIKYTRLNSHKLESLIKHGEIEGKQLLSLIPNKSKQIINIKQYLYEDIKYTVEYDEDKEEITRIYINGKDGIKKDIPLENSIFFKLSGKPNDYNKTPSKACSIVQQIKNHDRAYYDLRKSNSLYGFPTPAFKGDNEQSVKTTADAVNGTKWKVGKSFVSTTQMYYPVPPNSWETLLKEISITVKIISRRTGLPVHWLGWTDLMSNRATAEDLAELILTGTKTERLIWTEKLKEIILKIMQLSVDNGFDDAVYTEDFTVDLPYISLAYLDKIASVWMPLQMNGVISMDQLRNKLPGINPEDTEKEVEEEKQKNIENMKDTLGGKPNPLLNKKQSNNEEVEDE
jgi:hypothetical protein